MSTSCNRARARMFRLPPPIANGAVARAPSNYGSDAGRGSETLLRLHGPNWQQLLLSGVAAGALWTAAPRAVKAQALQTIERHSDGGDIVVNWSGDLIGGRNGIVAESSGLTTSGDVTVNVTDGTIQTNDLIGLFGIRAISQSTGDVTIKSGAS